MGDKNWVEGNSNTTITGKENVVKGNSNRITGNKNVVRGNSNDVMTDGNFVSGNSNVILDRVTKLNLVQGNGLDFSVYDEEGSFFPP